MTKFLNKRNKLNKFSSQIESNKRDIERKKSPDVSTIENTHLKNPKILYDSGWEATQAYPVENNTALEDQLAPLQASFLVRADIDIPENLLPFTNIAFLVKNHPDVTFVGVSEYQRYIYTSSPYYEIKGDANLIYQGYVPSKNKFSQLEIDDGDLLSANTSRWFYGTLKYSDGGDNYELRDGSISGVKTYFDVTASGAGANYPNWKSFECFAIDSISSSSVTGTGTYKVSTMIEQAPGLWFQQIVTTKNVTMSANLFEDVTHISAGGGLYKNDVFQQNYSESSPLKVKFYGSLNGKGTLPLPDWGSTATLVSFSYAQETTTIDDTEYDLFKLFYSSTRAVWFRFYDEPTYMLTSMPDTNDYQTGTLPYTKMYVKVNPDGHPVSSLDTSKNYNYASTRHAWSKISDNKFKLHLQGRFILHKKAEDAIETLVDFVDETYSISGSSYARDGANRDDKTIYYYRPPTIELEIKAQCILNPPTRYNYDKSRER
ncbi:MAG: hypothetical protein PVG65_00210 [Candidatus Thorarchaeota archaeon]|jgi:hypothetical protein